MTEKNVGRCPKTSHYRVTFTKHYVVQICVVIFSLGLGTEKRFQRQLQFHCQRQMYMFIFHIWCYILNMLKRKYDAYMIVPQL